MKFPAKINLIFVFALLLANYTHAQQGAAIGTTNPEPSAAFQVGERVSNINKGVLIPRTTTSIVDPTDGLLIYNTSSATKRIFIKRN